MATKKYIRWMAEQNKKGGKREGAGRKPVEEKAIPVTIYVRPSIIEEMGGKDEIQNIMKQAVFVAYKKKTK
jgi:hypothetical protein